MKKLFELYSDIADGAIHGWDRIRFRGTIRWLASTRGINTYLQDRGILIKDFKQWAQGITTRVRSASEEQAKRLGITIRYLNRSGIDKEALARQIAEEQGIDTGDICMFSVVENCRAPGVRGNRLEKTLELEMQKRRCVFIYHYWNDPVIGFGHTRLQTWLPLNVTLCINGRHWLERQLMAESIDYLKDGNCFPFISDPARAQELLDSQLSTNWPDLLNPLLRRNCPVIDDLFGRLPLRYFRNRDLRRHLYPDAEKDSDTDRRKRLSGRITRRLALLRAHGLIRKAPRTTRYVLTPKGLKISAAILAAARADSQHLMNLAA